MQVGVLGHVYGKDIEKFVDYIELVDGWTSLHAARQMFTAKSRALLPEAFAICIQI